MVSLLYEWNWNSYHVQDNESKAPQWQAPHVPVPQYQIPIHVPSYKNLNKKTVKDSVSLKRKYVKRMSKEGKLLKLRKRTPGLSLRIACMFYIHPFHFCLTSELFSLLLTSCLHSPDISLSQVSLFITLSEQKQNGNNLWQFLMRLLTTRRDVLAWTGKDLEFRIANKNEVIRFIPNI